VLRQFNLSGDPVRLPGGSAATFRVGQAVLKRLHDTSLENNHSPLLGQWIAAFAADLRCHGFRLPRPLPTVQHTWITSDGWSAWTFLEGRHATSDDIPACIPAIVALHQALKPLGAHPLLAVNQTPWGQAHRGCWGEKPAHVQPQLRALVDALYGVRQPLAGLAWQLIHGDLNPENILLAPGAAPALLDFAPFWAPPAFALAIFANFIGPRQGDITVLAPCAAMPGFTQLLIRAGIRMLLVKYSCTIILTRSSAEHDTFGASASFPAGKI
jgi:hypothetical protein